MGNSIRPIGLGRAAATRLALERELADRHHKYLATHSRLHPELWYVIVVDRSSQEIVHVITEDESTEERAA